MILISCQLSFHSSQSLVFVGTDTPSLKFIFFKQRFFFLFSPNPHHIQIVSYAPCNLSYYTDGPKSRPAVLADGFLEPRAVAHCWSQTVSTAGPCVCHPGRIPEELGTSQVPGCGVRAPEQARVPHKQFAVVQTVGKSGGLVGFSQVFCVWWLKLLLMWKILLLLLPCSVSFSSHLL